MFAFLPALILAGYWFGGEGVLTVFAVVFPLILLVIGLFDRAGDEGETDPLTGLATRAHLVNQIDDALTDESGGASNAIVIVLDLDDHADLRAHLGAAGFETVLRRVADRLVGTVRAGDSVGRLDSTRFGLVLRPARGAGMDVAMAASGRMQAAIAEPISIDAASVYVSASLGFCLARRAPQRDGAAMLEAAERALQAARRAGPASVRAFSASMVEGTANHSGEAVGLGGMFENNEIVTMFQPQIATQSGEVSGVEVLARWQHPTRGLLPPSEFLPALEEAGLMEQLGEIMLFQALSTLTEWDRAGHQVPRITLHLSTHELRNPRLVDRMQWELDRFDIGAERLTVEVLETMISRNPDETITSNIAALAALGCTVDLDDFGKGHASIGTIRRFAVQRLKLDRSIVRRCDEDRDQAQMVAAILSMAAELELGTIAEGVETAGELAYLGKLGCDHVQGLAITRPLHADDMSSWLTRHHQRASRSGGVAILADEARVSRNAANVTPSRQSQT